MHRFYFKIMLKIHGLQNNNNNGLKCLGPAQPIQKFIGPIQSEI